jgi:uncharacterized protein DUF1059
MPTSYSYSCEDYPGMEGCPARFRAATVDEVQKHVELHAAVAHGEDPAAWSPDDKALLTALIKPE